MFDATDPLTERSGSTVTCMLTNRQIELGSKHTSTQRRGMLLDCHTSAFGNTVGKKISMEACNMDNLAGRSTYAAEICRLKKDILPLGIVVDSRYGEGYRLKDAPERQAERERCNSYFIIAVEAQESPSVLNDMEPPPEFVKEKLEVWGLSVEPEHIQVRVLA